MAEAAVGKRIKITKIQQQQMLAILGASLVFGVSLVFAIYFVKYINFNSRVIAAKDESINNYYTAITNVGICKKTNENGTYSDKDLEDCDPSKIDINELSGTLRYNILIGMTENDNLESIARDSQQKCFGPNKRKIDYTAEYRDAKTEEQRQQALYMIKLCSSLRVIPDALPSRQNDEALMSSINQIFKEANQQPESLSPNKSTEVSPIASLNVIPVSLKVESTASETTALLQAFEKSIRPFSFQSATISWGVSDEGVPGLNLTASAYAFYTDEVTMSESTETLYATNEAKSATNGTSVGGSSDEEGE